MALVNSAQPPDSLATVAQLREFYDTWGYTGAHVRGAAELAAVQALRPTLRALAIGGFLPRGPRLCHVVVGRCPTECCATQTPPYGR